MSQPGHACRLAAALTALIMLLFCYAPIASPQNGHEVSGVYEITNAAEAGQSVRVTLRISLTSHTDSDLSVSSFALRTAMEPRPTETSASITLPSRASSEFNQEFTLSQREFLQWQRGLRPILFLRLVSPDGSRLARSIQLAPGLGIRTSPPGGN